LHGFRGKPLLIQDGERALWTVEAREALDAISLEVYEQHPPHSPDLDAIENALRERLNTTQPDYSEDREAFVRRLRAAVAWVNVHRRATLRYLCRNHKERAADVALQEGCANGVVSKKACLLLF